MTARNLLVELLVEELPPKSLQKLGMAFASNLSGSLKAQGLVPDGASVAAYASPRRLAVQIEQVAVRAPDSVEMRKLMPVSVALDASNKPTQAMRKALAKLGREHMADLWPNAVDGSDQLLVQPDGKASAVFLRALVKGVALQPGLQAALEAALGALPISKTMTYQLADGWTNVSFVRPAHGLVALHGSEVVPVAVLGLQAGRSTLGHRFEAARSPIELKDADSYARQLETEGAVIAAFDVRRAEVVRQLEAAAAAQGLRPIDDDALLDEVTALVERPNVLTCQFDPEFLAVPQECLILTMKANQKYFPLLDANGRLTHKFLVVSNIRPADPSAIVGGNERVVRPRLADAKFFFDQDRKRTLESRVPGLARVVYHNKLGTQGERVERVRALARDLGQALGGPALAAAADRAALLAKADLLTDMVGEFPELQGTMGGYYARHDGETEAVALAIEDHYKPRFAGDGLPRQEAGVVVALADKLETLAGLFHVGERPSGDRDPFALRRHALGVIRMMIERQLPLRLDDVLGWALRPFGAAAAAQAEVRAALAEFFFDRLDVSMKEQGFTALEVGAVIAGLRAGGRLAETPHRLAAVRAFVALPESAPLAAANKRVANILKKAERAVAPKVDAALLREAAEQALHQALQRVQPVADRLFEQGEYTASLRELAALKEPVDAFFDQVMVNVDDERLRNNRLALLAALHAAMNRVADLARLAS
jgi:glycyl-tRNA synthetase beta chain